MYATHQRTISKWARLNPANFSRVLQFVILTIKVPLWRVPNDTMVARQDDDDSLGVLYGHKAKAFRWRRPAPRCPRSRFREGPLPIASPISRLGIT